MNLVARIIGNCLLSSLAVLGTSAHAQDGTPNNAGVGKVLLDFSAISGDWVLNERCKSLKRAERREFEWTYFRLNELLQKELGPKVIIQIQEAATEVARAENHKECSPETVKLISQALDTSRHMNTVLTNTPYDPNTSYKEHLSEQFMAIETGLRVDAHCRHISPSLVTTIGRAHDAMIGYALRVIGGKPVNKLIADAEKASKRPEYETCGPDTKKAVHAASKGLRQLIELIEHDSVLTD